MTSPAPDRTLSRKRAVARLVLWVEQLWPALWPALAVIGVYACLALLNVPALLPPEGRIAVLAIALLLLGVAVWRGVRRSVRPGAEAVDRRLERDSGLRHRPLAALTDRPSSPTPEAASVWEEHVRRLRAQTGRLRLGWPRPGLAGRDRYALRGGLVVLLGAALLVAGAEAPGRLWRGVAPGWPAAAPGPATVVQAWVTPPAYTGLPPRFLRTDLAAVQVPAGAALAVNVTGGSGAPSLSLDGGTEPFRALDTGSWQSDRTLTKDTRLEVRRGIGALAAWSVTVTPDKPPVAAFTEPPGAMPGNPPTNQTRLPWRAEDDYGLVSVQAELRLRDRAQAEPLVVPLPLTGTPRTARAVAAQDLTAHPWAGLAVTARIVAKDAAGQSGASAPAGFVLPERNFDHPVARAVIAIRRQLSLTPDARAEAEAALDGIAGVPEAFNTDSGTLLTLRSTGALLRHGRGDAAVTEAQARLWELALSLEDGALDRTARALDVARQALRDALAEAKEAEQKGIPLTPEQQQALQDKMQALREAIQRQIEALTEQAKREGSELPFDPRAPQMDARELDRRAERMQEAAREGRTEDAQREMAELEQLLQELQAARPESGEARERRRAEKQERGQRQMSAVQDMVRREGGLLDKSQSRADARPDTRPDPRSAPQRDPERRSQQALRRALGELMQRQGDLTGEIPQALNEADLAMREAGEALGQGQDAAAGRAQKRAIEALQKGGREMGQQMARQFGTGEQPGEGEGDDPGDEPGQGTGQNGQDPDGNRPGQTAGPRPGEAPGAQRRRTARRDPLGRPAPQGTSGSEESGDVRVPDQMEQARTRALQDELRRRGAERTRPQPELDYIDRLLKAY